MEIKKLGFGFMRLPLINSFDQKSIDMEQLCQMVDTQLARGFGYFDTAYTYHEGRSEIALRDALVKRHARNSFLLATKMPIFLLKSREQQGAIFEEQLEKCGVDYFDYYMLHNIHRLSYPTAQKMGSFEYISELKKSGKIAKIGFSFHDDADLLEEVLTTHPEVDFVQLQINYLDWDNASIQSGKCYDVATKHGKKVIAMEPVKGGTLAKVPDEAEKILKSYRPELSVASWAIRFAASLDNVEVVLSGMSDMEQLLDNTGYMQDFVPLSDTEQDVLKQAVCVINASTSVSCTACRYCVESCPQNIAIPEYFSLFNAQMLDVNRYNFSSQLVYYSSLIEKYGKPSDCVACKKCEDICPQHLRITDYLKDAAEEFDGRLAAMAEAVKRMAE